MSMMTAMMLGPYTAAERCHRPTRALHVPLGLPFTRVELAQERRLQRELVAADPPVLPDQVPDWIAACAAIAAIA